MKIKYALAVATVSSILPAVSYAQIAAPGATTGFTQDTGLSADELKANSVARDFGFFSPDNGFELSAGFGLVVTSGNSDTLLFNGEFSAEKTWDNNEFGFIADFIYSEADSTTTAQYFHIGSKYNRIINDNYYYGLLVDGVHDDIAELDYRVGVYPYVGYNIWKTDRSSLSLEIGPGYTFEDQSGNSRSYLSARVAQLFEYNISDRSKFWQKAEWLPELEEIGDNYLINYEVGVSTQLTSKWNLKTFARGTYDSDVPDGIDGSDLGIFTTLSYGFVGETLDDLSKAQGDLGTNNSWQSTALIGGTYTGGNSETLLATANILSTREWGPNLLGLSLGGTYGETGDDVTAENWNAAANYRRTIQDPFYTGIGATYLHDDLSDVDYRATVSPNLGVYLIKNDTTTLNLEAGPAYVFEEVGGVEDNYLGLRVAQGLQHQLTDNLKVWETVEFLSDFDDIGDNYLVNFEIGFETKLSDRLSLNTYVQGIYDSEPAAGRDDLDLRFVSALAVSF